MRFALLAAGIVAGALATAAGGVGATTTQLRITVYPNGRLSQPVRNYRLRCAPAFGTVPQPTRACRTLAGLQDPFAPVPRDAICSQIALGPQEAFVVGTLRGKRIDARLTVRDGCEIARWQRLRTVVPGFPA